MSTLVMDARHTMFSRVLLVEDSVIDAKLITGLLRSPSAALHCCHVTQLAEALNHMEIHPPDVILLDLNLEDSSGYETFHFVRQVGTKAAILVLSGSDDEDLAIRMVREGAQDYVFFFVLGSVTYCSSVRRPAKKYCPDDRSRLVSD